MKLRYNVREYNGLSYNDGLDNCLQEKYQIERKRKNKTLTSSWNKGICKCNMLYTQLDLSSLVFLLIFYTDNSF